MRWLTYQGPEGPRSGVLQGGEIADLGQAALETWFDRRDEARARADDAPRLPAADVRLLQPVLRPGKILGIGLNYRDHAAETGREPPAVQLWFNKQSTAANAPFDPVHLPRVSDKLDFEAELVFVIGRAGRHISREKALDHVAGFCCGCDYSVRDWQRASPTMIMGKGFDTHAPFGPWIVTPDEFGPLGDQGVRAIVNGETRQDGRLSDMIFSVEDQIAHLSAAFTLEPGDVIFTGTPAGVGVAEDPPRFLTPGDTVRIEIDGVGAIEQTIVPEPDPVDAA